INESDPKPVVSINDVSVPEGNSGTSNATLTVTMTGARSISISVSWYTSTGTAYGDSDFQYTYGTVTFAPGDTQKTITVPIFGDTVYEGDEYFFVYINSSDATVAKNFGRCTILDDDPAPSITASDVSIVEGNSGRTNAVITL